MKSRDLLEARLDELRKYQVYMQTARDKIADSIGREASRTAYDVVLDEFIKSLESRLEEMK